MIVYKLLTSERNECYAGEGRLWMGASKAADRQAGRQVGR